jgi:photosystem II stability/assembly factor-like uncharacterized protein
MKKTIASILLLVSTISTNAQWDLVEGPLPYSIYFRGLAFINDSTGFTTKTTDATWPSITSEVLMTTDYGETWVSVYSHTDVDDPWADRLTNITFIDSLHGWACGEVQPYILKTNDGGITWTAHEIEGFVENHYFEKIEFADENYGIAYGGTHAIETTDGGLNWVYRDSLNGYDVSFIDQCNFVINDGNLKNILNCEILYQEFPTINEEINRVGVCVHMVNENNWILGARGQIGFSNFPSLIRTSDSGSTFEILDFPFGDWLSQFDFVSPIEGYATVANTNVTPCSLIKTYDGGESWFCIETPFDTNGFYRNFSYFDCPSPQVCYGISGSNIYRTMNGGGELSPLPTHTTEIESEIISISPNPATNDITISGKTFMTEIQLFNSVGQLIHLEKINDKTAVVDISAIKLGVYIVAVKSKSGISYQRFVKQ